MDSEAHIYILLICTHTQIIKKYYKFERKGSIWEEMKVGEVREMV